MIRLGRDQEKQSLSREKKLEGILAMTFDPMVKIELEKIVEEIRGLQQRIARLEKPDARKQSNPGCRKPRVKRTITGGDRA
jgi:hypothetical protein